MSSEQARIAELERLAGQLPLECVAAKILFTIAGGQIVAIDLVADAERHRQLDLATVGD
jgi:hypothetical protein